MFLAVQLLKLFQLVTPVKSVALAGMKPASNDASEFAPSLVSGFSTPAETSVFLRFLSPSLFFFSSMRMLPTIVGAELQTDLTDFDSGREPSRWMWSMLSNRGADGPAFFQVIRQPWFSFLHFCFFQCGIFLRGQTSQG